MCGNDLWQFGLDNWEDNMKRLYRRLMVWRMLGRMKQAKKRGDTIPLIMVDKIGRVNYDDVVDWLFVLGYEGVGLHLIAAKLSADHEIGFGSEW